MAIRKPRQALFADIVFECTVPNFPEFPRISPDM
jgi:hypothetical protein